MNEALKWYRSLTFLQKVFLLVIFHDKINNSPVDPVGINKAYNEYHLYMQNANNKYVGVDEFLASKGINKYIRKKEI